MSERVEKLVEEIKGLTLLEAATLVKRLEETLGVSAAAAAPVVVAGAAGGGAAAGAAPAEEQTEFSVVLTAVGANKINAHSMGRWMRISKPSVAVISGSSWSCSLCGADHRLLWSAILLAKQADDIDRSSAPPRERIATSRPVARN